MIRSRVAPGGRQNFGALVADLQESAGRPASVRARATPGEMEHRISKMAETIARLARALDEQSVRSQDTFTAPPGPHAKTHRPGASDPLPTEAPQNPTGATASEGTSRKFLRSDMTLEQGIVTTKGDILGYSTVPARHAVGSNNDLLLADSAQTTGLRWDSIADVLGVILTTNGDLLYVTGGTPSRLAVGDDDDVLTVASGLPAWAPTSKVSGLEILQSKTVVTSSQVLALNTTPITLLAGESGYANVPLYTYVRKPAGTAYTIGTATGLQLRYTNGAGQVVGAINSTALGALLASSSNTAQLLISPASAPATLNSGVDIATWDNTPIVIFIPTANVTDGDSDLHVIMWYMRFSVTASAS